MQPATIDPTVPQLPLWLGGSKQVGMQSFAVISAYDKHQELNLRHIDHQFKALYLLGYSCL